MWGSSWIGWMMKMKDMPYSHYKSSKNNSKHEESGAKEGSINILKEKFGKYVKK